MPGRVKLQLGVGESPCDACSTGAMATLFMLLALGVGCGSVKAVYSTCMWIHCQGEGAQPSVAGRCFGCNCPAVKTDTHPECFQGGLHVEPGLTAGFQQLAGLQRQVAKIWGVSCVDVSWLVAGQLLDINNCCSRALRSHVKCKAFFYIRKAYFIARVKRVERLRAHGSTTSMAWP